MALLKTLPSLYIICIKRRVIFNVFFKDTILSGQQGSSIFWRVSNWCKQTNQVKKAQAITNTSKVVLSC